MDKLPTEVLEQVLDQLSDDNDILNLPAWVVSRGLSESSLSDLFGTVEILLERKSLERRKCIYALSISRALELRTYVCITPWV